ncbi:GIY-YIG nuclease family protein [Nocardioides sp. 1609]|uniref:GIY-YIG nuclease family protein n=1 Tax=Nocardioides sp. 1609 TaxID=2508327 RepID=UPI001FD66518|nr:GIY-YIG nuclease family protein [Nocardioides sp. 1609]
MISPPSPAGDLTLGHLLAAAGLDDVDDAIALRHTIRPKDPASLRDLSPESVLAYTRVQTVRTNILPATPPPLWLVFAADGQRGSRARLHSVYANHGELHDQRTDELRTYDLRPSPVLRSLAGRLLVDWGAGAIGWAKRGPRAATLPVVEIADPSIVAFPGYGGVLVTFDELRQVTSDPSYALWRSALSSVQGVYAISDARTGQLYVGKADGGERILGRWATYADDGHGGNVALRELGIKDPSHKHHFVFSILRVFDPNAPTAEVNAAESHFKQALLTRQFGLNRN